MKAKPKKTFTRYPSIVTLYLLLTAYCLLPFGTAFAQTDDVVSSIEGLWTIEQAAVLKITGGDTLKIDVNTVKENSFVALFDALQFKGNTLILSFANDYFQGEYTLTGSTIEIHFTPAPFVLSYRVEGEKIYFTQEATADCVYVVQTVYKKD
jgi:hypothetical protein